MKRAGLLMTRERAPIYSRSCLSFEEIGFSGAADAISTSERMSSMTAHDGTSITHSSRELSAWSQARRSWRCCGVSRSRSRAPTISSLTWARRSSGSVSVRLGSPRSSRPFAFVTAGVARQGRARHAYDPASTRIGETHQRFRPCPIALCDPPSLIPHLLRGRA